jgi:hypothetical protein
MDLATLPARTQLTIVLLVGTTLMSTVAALNTSNYQQFFPALEQLQVRVASLHSSPNNQSLNGTVILTLENPTGYSGLVMQSMITNFTVTFANGTTIPQGTIDYNGIPKRLDPTTPVNITLQLVGSGTGPEQVTQLIKDGQIPEYAFSVSLILSTFLDQVLGMTIPYQCSATTGPISCDQIGILLTPHGGVSGGGGGGR